MLKLIMKLFLVSSVFLSSVVMAEGGEDRKGHYKKGKNREERVEYEKEGIELRRAHIEEARKKHVELINKMYDLKLTHLSELEEIGKKIETAKPEEVKALMSTLKEKRKEHKKLQKEFKDKTIKKELSELREGFYQKMKDRREEMKKSKAN